MMRTEDGVTKKWDIGFTQEAFAHIRVAADVPVSLYGERVRVVENSRREARLVLEAYVIGRSRGPVQIPPHPRDWWEAVKARWAPHWLLRRWPVRLTRYEVEALDVYPRAELPDGIAQWMGEPVRIYGPAVLVEP